MTVWVVRLGNIITAATFPIADMYVRHSVEMSKTEYYDSKRVGIERGI